jgi:hypothetical protein
MKSGPTAKPRMKTDMASGTSPESGLRLKSLAMFMRAGAIIELDTGEMKVKSETVIVAAHFFCLLQFLGFKGSFGPSQVTRLTSFSDRLDLVDGLRSIIDFAPDLLRRIEIWPKVPLSDSSSGRGHSCSSQESGLGASWP